MPRYFFNIDDNGAPIPDDLGEDFDLVEAAREHAQATYAVPCRGQWLNPMLPDCCCQRGGHRAVIADGAAMRPSESEAAYGPHMSHMVQSRRTTMFAMSGTAPIAAVMLQCHDWSKSAINGHDQAPLRPKEESLKRLSPGTRMSGKR
jgi:hypothetical protein